MTNAIIGASLTAAFSADELTEGKGFGLGDNYTDSTGRVYKFVRYDPAETAVAAVAGNFAYYIAEVGAETFVVTSDLSDSGNVGAGMLMSAPAAGEYCWIQVQGPATLTTALTAGADGNALTPVGATDGTLDVSNAVTDHVCAIAVDASAKKVLITCSL